MKLIANLDETNYKTNEFQFWFMVEILKRDFPEIHPLVVYRMADQLTNPIPVSFRRNFRESKQAQANWRN